MDLKTRVKCSKDIM